MHEDKVLLSFGGIDFKTSKPYLNVTIDGWANFECFAGRLRLSDEEFIKIVTEQFNAYIRGYSVLCFEDPHDFPKFKEWYLATRSVSKLLETHND